MVVNVKQPSGDEWKFAGNPIKIQGSSEFFQAAPSEGENTAEILSSLLGYSEEYLDQLKNMNVIWRIHNG
jgi:crotonobetainyl-CoA:carnitine CoA-transferase CaiB-like acyl-CoA transferase